MKPFRWSAEKNALLKQERGIGFEDVTVAVESGALLDVVSHPNAARYPLAWPDRRLAWFV